MNFTTLKTELSDRGFAFLTDTRLGQYVNWAYQELAEADLWPFMVTSTSVASSGSAVTIGTALGPVISAHVVSGSRLRSLAPMSFQDWQAATRDTGSTTDYPTHFSVNYTDGTVQLYPYASTLTVAVRYYQRPIDLTGTDVPPVPARWHRTIVDIATRMAYRDSDNHQAAEALQAQIDRDLWAMRVSFFTEQTVGADGFIHQVEGWQ